MPSFVEVSILDFQKVVIGSKYIIITVKMVTTDLLYLGENGNSLSVPNQVNGAVVGQIQTCIPGSQPLLLWNGALSQQKRTLQLSASHTRFFRIYFLLTVSRDQLIDLSSSVTIFAGSPPAALLLHPRKQRPSPCLQTGTVLFCFFFPCCVFLYLVSPLIFPSPDPSQCLCVWCHRSSRETHLSFINSSSAST